jgi:hypothetical protein
MPYDLMTDEHIRERLAAGEAQLLATSPAEIVEYDGARWTRAGDMWVLEAGNQALPHLARPEQAPAEIAADKAEPAPVSTEPAVPERAVPLPSATGLKHQPRPEADQEAEQEARQGPENVSPGSSPSQDTAPRRPRRKRVYLSAACLAVLAGITATYVANPDQTQQATLPSSAAPPPPPLRGPGADRDEHLAPEPPGTGETRPAPPDLVTDGEPVGRAGARPDGDILPGARPPAPPATDPDRAPAPPPPVIQPAPPPAQPPVPDPPAQQPPPPALPATPDAAAADLTARVSAVRHAGHLSPRGEGQLLRATNRIQRSVSARRTRQASVRIRRLLREMDGIRERGELTVPGERVLEQAVARLRSALRSDGSGDDD